MRCYQVRKCGTTSVSDQLLNVSKMVSTIPFYCRFSRHTTTWDNFDATRWHLLRFGSCWLRLPRRRRRQQMQLLWCRTVPRRQPVIRSGRRRLLPTVVEVTQSRAAVDSRQRIPLSTTRCWSTRMLLLNRCFTIFTFRVERGNFYFSFKFQITPSNYFHKQFNSKTKKLKTKFVKRAFWYAGPAACIGKDFQKLSDSQKPDHF